MNATKTKSNAIALLGALLLATAAAPGAAAGNSGAPSPRSGLNASMAQRDAMALLGVLMLAGASNPSRGSTLGVVLLVVAADGVRVPARMPSETLRSPPTYKPMSERTVPAGGMPGIKPQLPCRISEMHLERVGQLCYRSWQRLPTPWHEDFRRHGAGNPLIHTC
jgi:hypothetical protein